MSAKLEWSLVAALGVACVAVYYASEQREASVAPAATAPAATGGGTRVGLDGVRGLLGEDPLGEPQRPEMPWLATSSLSEGLPTSGAWRGHPCMADVNADGHLDLVASIRRIDHSTPGEGLFVFQGDGAGGWTSAVAGLRRDMGYGGSALADVNNDGHLDIAFSGHDVTPQVFVGGDPQGRWLLSWSAYDLSGISADVALGDLDGDGKADLASIALFSEGDGMVVFRGDGEGRFEKWQELAPRGVYGATVEVLDLEGDGRNELVAVSTEGPQVWSFSAEGGWQNRSAGLPKPSTGGTDLDFVAIDLDGDSIKELVVAGMIYPGHEPMRVFRWDGTAWARWGSGLPDGEGFFSLALANLGPGQPPSFVAVGAFGVQLFQLTGPQQFTSRGRLEGVSDVFNVACGDIDADGRDEILCVGTSGVSVLRLADTSFASASNGGGR
jgi:hypothetical protein